MGKFSWPPEPTLELVGEFVTLSRYQSSDGSALSAALADERVWAHIPTHIPTADEWDAFAAKGSSGGRWMWVARLNVERAGLGAGTVVGTTSFYDVSLDDAHLSVGYTMFRPEVQGDVVNAEAKLLMLRYAFVDRELARVEFRVDANNATSRAAVLSLGATQEGILRSHMRRRDGSLRDSVIFSILAPEWPAAEARITARLARRR